MTAQPDPALHLSPARSRLGRLAWLGVLLGGVAAYLLVLRTLVATQNPNFVPSLLLLGSIVVPATVLVFAASRGTQSLAPSGLLSFVAVTGGVIGTAAAGTLEYDTLRRLGALPMVMVGLIEESAKLVVPVIVLIVLRARRSPVLNPRAGVLVGVASGMGFATLETMGYGFSALLKEQSIAAVDATLLLRALLSPAGHVAWTGLTVAAIWAISGSAHKGRAVLRAIGTFVAAVLLHAAWDGIDNLVSRVIVGTIGVVALLVTIRRSYADPHRRRRASQGGQGGIAPADATTGAQPSSH